MPDFSFSQKNRLRSPKEFDAVFQNGKRFFGRYFILILLPNQQNIARLGLVISKRKCRLSVHRNYVRRCVREQFRCQTQLTGYDVVVLLKRPIDQPKKVPMGEQLSALFKKVPTTN